jgi:hypothetical protein
MATSPGTRVTSGRINTARFGVIARLGGVATYTPRRRGGALSMVFAEDNNLRPLIASGQSNPEGGRYRHPCDELDQQCSESLNPVALLDVQ